jgi:hypothetical protein
MSRNRSVPPEQSFGRHRCAAFDRVTTISVVELNYVEDELLTYGSAIPMSALSPAA